MCAHFSVNGVHIYPKTKAKVVVLRAGQRTPVEMQFGLIPSFEKSEKPKMVFHNARSETVFEKPSFRDSILTSRCLVTLDSFYEYVWKDPATMQPSDKVNFLARFYNAELDGEKPKPLTAAGVLNEWRAPNGEVIGTFAILTTEPNNFIANVGHDRSPVFLKEEYFDQWLDPKNTSRTVLSGILHDPLAVDLAYEIEPQEPRKTVSKKTPDQGSLF